MEDLQVSLDEILAEMDELGRAKFESAHARAVLKKSQARVAELENEKTQQRPSAVKTVA